MLIARAFLRGRSLSKSTVKVRNLFSKFFKKNILAIFSLLFSELSNFCSVSMKKNEESGCCHITVLNGNYETIYDNKKFQPPDKEERDRLIEIFDSHYIVAYMAAEIFAEVGYRFAPRRLMRSSAILDQIGRKS